MVLIYIALLSKALYSVDIHPFMRPFTHRCRSCVEISVININKCDCEFDCYSVLVEK